VTDARQFGRVAVLGGGDSSERGEFRCSHGNAVLAGTQGRGIDGSRLNPREQPLTRAAARFDRV